MFQLISIFLVLGAACFSLADVSSQHLPNVDEALAFHTDALSKLEFLTKQTSNLVLARKDLDDMDNAIVEKLDRVEDLIRQVNRRQLQALMEKIKEIEKKDIARRDAKSKNPPSGASSLSDEDLNVIFNQEAIFEDSDVLMENWIKKILLDEVLKLVDPLQSSPPSEKKDQQAEIETTGGEKDTAVECVRPELAAQKVQQAVSKFTQELSGVDDHALRGSIVHEMTSETFSPPPEPSHSLGSVWWSRFIPQDWEGYLPEFWQDWNAAVPAFFVHTLFGNLLHLPAEQVAPPEAILDAVTLPGSCWPMNGNSGTVTIRLAYPVQVSSISIDHASTLLMSNKDEQRASAPKTFKIYGYPPCEEGSNCAGFGFDAKHRVILKTFDYDVEQGGVQTFEIESGNDGELQGGSCSAKATTESSCSAPPATEEGVYAAIGVEVLSNWGNGSYTCLYRVRIHGEPSRL